MVSGILELYYILCALCSYIYVINGKSCSIRFQRDTICLGYVG